MRYASIVLIFLAVDVSAQEICVEPFRPDAKFLADAGYSAEEMREEYRAYFEEVENSLNCLNQTASQIREDATAAAQDYNRVLDQHRLLIKPHQTQEPVELIDDGTLFLDHSAAWLR